MSDFGFPSPQFNEDMQPFFEGTAQRRFMMMRCRQCGFWNWPYGGCRNHDNEPYLGNMEWTPASGRGKVHSFTIARVPFNDAFPVPYVYGIVETEEGPIIPTNIVGCAPEEVSVGMPVTVMFEEAPNGLVLPKFKPA
jgi:3-oxo-4,17-pregnadiene-20-carboxyl-CoA hydratase alpha subunit